MIKLNRVQKEALALLKTQPLSAEEIKSKVGERRFRHVNLLSLEWDGLIMCSGGRWQLKPAGEKLVEESEKTQKT